MKLDPKMLGLVIGGAAVGFFTAPEVMKGWINQTVTATDSSQPNIYQGGDAPAVGTQIAIAPTSRALTVKLGGAVVGALAGYLASRVA